MIFRVFLFIYCLNLFKCSNDFCVTYKCKCSNEEIKCKLNNTKLNVSLSPSVSKLDLSNNSIENIVFFSNQTKLSHLLLNNNRIKFIDENFFNKLTQLNKIDLSNNAIELMNENAFKNLHSSLSYLNVSNAFNSSYLITRELCELISLKVLDISYSILTNFTLRCWQDQSGQLEELYLRNSLNAEISWLNWYPYIGNKLKVIDLTSSNLITIDSSLSKQPMLTTLILKNNKQLDKAALFQLLNNDNLIGKLISLNLANITASESLTKLIDHSLNDSLNLMHLDVSFNNFTDDLNAFLFNQLKFKKLKTFKASHNQFKQCEQKLLTINNKTLLESLQVIDLSFNNLEGSKCLHSIKTIDNLQSLDLSHNKLSLLLSDLADLAGIFAHMVNLSSIDLSFNSFSILSLYFNPFHTKIVKFDVSRNNLKSFRFMSIHSKDNVKYPFNIIDETKSYYEYADEDDYYDNKNAVTIDNKHEFDDDDDERFIIIDELNLSYNNLIRVNLQHMLQSIRNIKHLDFSHNPINQVIRMSNERSIVKDDIKSEQDDLTEILCIDNIDFNNCKIDRLPNLEHICINRLNFAYNLMNGSSILIMSNFSIYFTDYINLQFNNITHLKVLISKQLFKQDYYLKKNSPISYYYGQTNSTNLIHTYIDLNQNKNYKCDCDEMRLLKETAFIQIVNECLIDEHFKHQCASSNENRVTIYSLNKKFRILFVITCTLLLILSGLIVYYMCSDCIKNMQPYEVIRFNLHQLFNRLRDLRHSSVLEGESNSSKVHYSKLKNDFLSSSSNNINIDI